VERVGVRLGEVGEVMQNEEIKQDIILFHLLMILQRESKVEMWG